jgi:hypothetical protein
MDEQRPTFLTWDHEMPLLSNRFFLYDMGKLFCWTALFGAVLFGAIAMVSGGARALSTLMMMLGFILFGLLFLFVLIPLVVFRNRFQMRFLVSAHGVGWEMIDRRGRRASRLAILAGALAGSATGVGAGMLAVAGEKGLLAWREVRKIKAYPGLGVISIMNSWRVVARLYCRPDDYPNVMQWLRWGATNAVFQERGAAPAAVPETSEGGSPLLEVQRRLAVQACFCACIWLAFWTPPVLVEVQQADFAAEYQSEHGDYDARSGEVADEGDALIPRSTLPHSVKEYAQRTVENVTLQASGPQWADLYRRCTQAPIFLSARDGAVASILPQMAEVRKRGRAMSYLQVPSEGKLAYLEFQYHDLPREAHAPSSLVYPRRGMSWIWLAIGLALYLALPWHNRTGPTLTGDRGTVTIVDLLGFLFASFFFAIPLYAVSYSDQVLGSELGISVFCWIVAMSGIGILMWSARLCSARKGA